MEFKIRTEQPSDYKDTNQVIFRAFKGIDHTDGDEHNLVDRLRDSDAFIPELSLVAEMESQIIGHIIFSRIKIVSDLDTSEESLALAPVSVLPEYQKKKIGASLIEKGHQIAKGLGFKSVILLGHPEYYPRFGYSKASNWGIKAPFDVPDAAFMAIELVDGALNDVSGVVRYSSAFMLD